MLLFLKRGRPRRSAKYDIFFGGISEPCVCSSIVYVWSFFVNKLCQNLYLIYSYKIGDTISFLGVRDGGFWQGGRSGSSKTFQNFKWVFLKSTKLFFRALWNHRKNTNLTKFSALQQANFWKKGQKAVLRLTRKIMYKKLRFFGAYSTSELLFTNFELERAPKKREFFIEILLKTLKRSFGRFFSQKNSCSEENLTGYCLHGAFRKLEKSICST